MPFDAGRLTVTGSPVPILEDVSGTGAAGGDFAYASAPAAHGTLAYLPKQREATWPISWVDRAGKTQPLLASPDRYHTPRFSPDGKRLAFSAGSGSDEDIWVKDLDRDRPSRLTVLGANRSPVWTPDGKNIVFQSTNPSAPGLYSVRSDGSGEPQPLTDGKLNEIPYSFSPDGKRLAFQQTSNGGGLDIFTAPIEPDPSRGADGVRLGKPEPFLGTPFVETDPAFSPDGRWLAYESNESGTFGVYVRPFPGSEGKWQISDGGGRFPVWSRDGRELLFESMDGHVMAASYNVKGASFAAGRPRMWTDIRLRGSYDLAPDGKRLAAMVAEKPGGEKPPTHLTFLLNFIDELRRRAPVK